MIEMKKAILWVVILAAVVVLLLFPFLFKNIVFDSRIVNFEDEMFEYNSDSGFMSNALELAVQVTEQEMRIWAENTYIRFFGLRYLCDTECNLVYVGVTTTVNSRFNFPGEKQRFLSTEFVFYSEENRISGLSINDNQRGNVAFPFYVEECNIIDIPTLISQSQIALDISQQFIQDKIDKIDEYYLSLRRLGCLAGGNDFEWTLDTSFQREDYIVNITTEDVTIEN